jgi:chemosensory pili system protein ChpC
MNTPARDIRGVMITVGDGRLLLPNASVAEVITYSEPEPVGDDTPPWLLGRVRWRGWRLPLLSFAKFAGWEEEEGSYGAKVAVLKALGGNPKLPFFAVRSQGFPRLVTVPHSRVVLNEETAVVPDMLTLEVMIDKALAQAAA